MTTPIEILRKELPAVLRKEKAFIVSTIEKPTERHRYFYYRQNSGFIYLPKTEQRICYYIKNTKTPVGINFNCIGIFSEFFSLKNEKKDPDRKYEIVGDFLPNPDSLIDVNCNTYSSKEAIRYTLEYFDKKHDLIDTIVVVDNEPLGANPKIIYDRTGKLDVADKLFSKMKYQRRNRILAEISGDPKALKEQGYFDEPFEKQTEKPLEPEEPIDEYSSIFDFGKKRLKVSLRSLMADIKFLLDL
jgi:hypothetical protein